LLAWRLAITKQRIQDRDAGAQGQLGPLSKRSLPALLQSSRQVRAH